jgi:hypothetical protein
MNLPSYPFLPKNEAFIGMLALKGNENSCF